MSITHQDLWQLTAIARNRISEEFPWRDVELAAAVDRRDAQRVVELIEAQDELITAQVSMALDGQTDEEIDAWMRASQEWADHHAAPPPPPPSPGRPIEGLLRISGGIYQDDRGPILPVFCHLGDGFSRYRRDPDAVRRLLDDVARAGFHGVRTWTYLTGSYWAGRECDAGWQRDQWWTFAQEVSVRRLQMIVSQGDMWQADRETRQRVYEAVRDTPRAAIAFCDAGNEVPNNGWGTPTECADWIAGLPGILSLSTTQSETAADLHRWSRSPAMIYDEHGYRGGNWWDPVRHVMNVAFENRPPDRPLGMQSEPFGVGSRVTGVDHMDELTDAVMAFAGIVSVMTGQAWVWFSGPGVISDEADRLQDMPGFWSTPPAVAQLPPDIMSYRTLVHGGSSQGNKRVYGVTDEPGSTRCDHAIHDDGRFICCIYGPDPQYDIIRSHAVDGDFLFGPERRVIWGRVG